MILIHSSEKDRSTDEVINWILRDGHPFLRINEQDRLVDVEVRLSETGDVDIGMTYQLKSGSSVSFSLSEVRSYWYRWGDLRKGYAFQHPDPQVRMAVEHHLFLDWESIKALIYRLLESKHSLGSFFAERNNNKLYDLLLAAQAGLPVPATVVSTSKGSLHRFLDQWPESVTKNIRLPVRIAVPGLQLAGRLVRDIRKEDLEGYPERVAPSLFQQKIPKLFDLRVFFLKEDLYPMAIFSQSDEQTRTDYRNHNPEKLNRMAPYTLPEEWAEKLRHFIRRSQLDTGSVDLVVTPEEDVVFLEVNPVGQFDFVSAACNYFLEKKIANYLMSYEHG